MVHFLKLREAIDHVLPDPNRFLTDRKTIFDWVVSKPNSDIACIDEIEAGTSQLHEFQIGNIV